MRRQMKKAAAWAASFTACGSTGGLIINRARCWLQHVERTNQDGSAPMYLDACLAFHIRKADGHFFSMVFCRFHLQWKFRRKTFFQLRRAPGRHSRMKFQRPAIVACLLGPKRV